MAIDPNLVTTVQVKELPPNPLSLTDNIPHEVGDILSRATMQELVDFIRANSQSYQYEIKIIRAPNIDYINDNFDMLPSATQGLGLVGGLWEGWAICNGNNGTDNLDGITFIGYGANYGTLGQFVGEAEHTLTIDEMPSHNHGILTNESDSGNNNNYVQGGDLESPSLSPVGTELRGGGEPHNNMQPSMVVLKIMKL